MNNKYKIALIRQLSEINGQISTLYRQNVLLSQGEWHVEITEVFESIGRIIDGLQEELDCE